MTSFLRAINFQNVLNIDNANGCECIVHVYDETKCTWKTGIGSFHCSLS